LQNARRRQNFQPAIDHHAQGLTRRRHVAHSQIRIVVAHGTDTGQDGAGTGPPGVTITARIGAGDPLADAVVERSLSIQTGRRLEA